MDNTFVFLLNDFIWFIGLYTYYTTENILYVFGIMVLVNFIYFFIDDLARFFYE